MAWDFDRKEAKVKEAFVREGNIDVYLIGSTPIRVRFLVEDTSVEDVMAEYGLHRESAQDKLLGEISQSKWLQPKSYWVHVVSPILNQRFYSTAFCQGKRDCVLCVENKPGKEMGIENRQLPYPIRRSLYVPAYFYDMGRVLFIKGGVQFFEDISRYIDKQGSGVDFEIFSTGKGLATKYCSMYMGKSEMSIDELKDKGVTWLAPHELNMMESDEAILKKINGKLVPNIVNNVVNEVTVSSTVCTTSESGRTTKDDSSDFVLDFGQHRGKTLSQIHNEGGIQFLKFLTEHVGEPTKSEAINFCKHYNI